MNTDNAKFVQRELPQCFFSISRIGSRYILNGEELDISEMYNLSEGLLPRILRQLLDNWKNEYFFHKSETTYVYYVSEEHKEYFENLVKECIEYRCNKSADIGRCEILRQLPMKVAIEESDKLIALGKKHAIYSSARGGYNIKVHDYTNSSLDRYCYYDSGMWD